MFSLLLPVDANSPSVFFFFFLLEFKLLFELFVTDDDGYLSTPLRQSHFKIAPVTSWLHYWVNIGEFLGLTNANKHRCHFHISS